ncbi:transcriptional antiterminator, BglG family [Caloramator fervidus]|uniref:Transcriptional antiterminator, BglG family n=1 Tax=Caloramator fervidus TaxID=29344 RepID=A0A1H5WSI0_9CLOT|nr:PRD domain-containing protein [Caloramator fervidus]SEG02374.1 transcriptional antiterminator, BglG family [Caloramator fervidus]
MEGYEVVKVFNNNVVLAKKEDIEYILIDRGIGFNTKKGEKILKDAFEKVFILESDIKDKFTQLISRTDKEIVGVCEEVINMISKEYDDLNKDIHIKLVDHIAFAVKRIKEKDEIENPFLTEIETLYTKEYEIAKRAASLIEERLNIKIPEGEIGFIALHINAAKSKESLSNTIKSAYICNSIAEIIEDELKIEIDRKSIDYARFVTHIKFTIHRVINNIPIKNELKASIKRKYKESYRIAKLVVEFLEKELDQKISDDEVAYIAMHIEKLKNRALF